MKGHEFDVGYWLLDDELVDADGRRCGKVDDVEFSGRPGRKTRLDTILCGPGAFRERLPGRLRKLATRVLSDEVVEVPWRQVKETGVVVKLKRPARELGLGRGDDEAGKIVGKIPGA